LWLSWEGLHPCGPLSPYRKPPIGPRKGSCAKTAGQHRTRYIILKYMNGRNYTVEILCKGASGDTSRIVALDQLACPRSFVLHHHNSICIFRRRRTISSSNNLCNLGGIVTAMSIQYIVAICPQTCAVSVANGHQCLDASAAQRTWWKSICEQWRYRGTPPLTIKCTFVQAAFAVKCLITAPPTRGALCWFQSRPLSPKMSVRFRDRATRRNLT